MNNSTDQTAKLSLLRQNAEELLKRRSSDNELYHSNEDVMKLIHELEIYQIELEMQNEELLQAISETEDAIDLYDTAPTGYFSVSKSGEITRLNFKGAKMLGKEPFQLIKSNFLFFLSDESKPVFNLFLEKAFHNQLTETCEVTLLTEANSPMVVQLSGNVTKNREQCLITAVDITEIKQTEVKLRDNKKFLDEVQLIAMFGTFSIDLIKGSWTSSEVLNLIFGIGNDFDKSAKGWVSIIHPEWQQVMRDYFNLEIKANKKKFDKEYKIIRQNDQSERWVHAIAHLEFDANDRPTRIVGIIYDITERKQVDEKLFESETSYRMLYENSLTGILVTHPDGSILAANPEICRMLGRTEEDICRIGRDGIVNTADPNLARALEERKRTGHFHGELTYVRADGTIFPVDVESGIFTDAKGQIRSYNFVQDITCRKRAEEEIKESEFKFRNLIENSPDAIGIYVDGKIALVNKECLRLLAADNADELIGKPVMEFVHPDYKAIVMERMQEAVHEGVVLPLTEEKFIRLDGSVVDVEVKAMAIKLDNTPAVQLIVRDITERKLVEEALREIEVNLNAVFNTTDESIFLMATDETLLSLNEIAAKRMGQTPEKLIGCKLCEIMPPEVILHRRPFIDLALRTGKSVKFDDERDGLWVANHLYPILNADGKVIRLAVFSRDITDRKETEQALRKSNQQYNNLAAKIPVGVYILHSKPDGTFTLDYVSQRMAEMLNLSIDNLLADENHILQSIHPDDKESFFKLNMEGIRLGQPFNWKGRILIDGKEKYLHFRSIPELLEDGDILWHGLIMDITERVMADAEIQKINQELSKLIAEKDKFFSIIAHDLRSPFNVLLGLTQILDEDLSIMDTAQIREIVSVLRSSTKNVYRLVENLLEWSNIKRGVTNFNPELYNLSSRMDEFILPIFELANKKRIEISKMIPEDLIVFAELNMLGSIIRNLTSNAVKFTPKDGKIVLSARVLPDQSIEISVKDTGIGMNADILDKLFNIYENTNRKGTDGEPSTGLGLIICKEFVEKHGGEIRAESEAGKGSTFYFTLPAQL